MSYEIGTHFQWSTPETKRSGQLRDVGTKIVFVKGGDEDSFPLRVSIA